MVEGFYSIAFRGYTDWGTGVLVLCKGVVAGVDIGGVSYDGFYNVKGNFLHIALTLTVPPGVALVQGVAPQSKPYSFKIETTIDLDNFSSSKPVQIKTVYGPVNVVFKKLRNFPHEKERNN